VDTLNSEISFLRIAEKRESDKRHASVALSRRFVSLLMAVAVVALTVNVLTLTTYPAIHTDEAWYANLAQNWLATGSRWTTLDIGAFPDGRGQGTTTLGAVPTRLAIQAWGLSLKSIRLPSLLAGLALLGVVAGVGSLLWPGRSGPLASLVLLTQPLFLLGSHLARPEIWLALVVLLALGCSVLGWKRNQLAWDVVAGLLAVLAVEIHQNGTVFAVGLAVAYLVRYGRAVLRQRGSLAFYGTSLLGMMAYLYRHVDWLLPDQGSGSAGGFGAHASHSMPLLSDNPLQWVVNELVRYLLYFGKEPLAALLLGLGIAAALRRRGMADRVLLAWLAGSALAMMLLVSHKLETYLLPMLSVGALLVGHGMADLLEREGARGRQAVALTFGVLALPLLLTLGESGTNQTAQLQRELQAAVPCERILGPNRYWLAFSDCDFRSWDVVSHYHHLRGTSFEESMAAIRPDYLLIDSTIVSKLRDDFEMGSQAGSYYALPREDFQRFLDERTTLVRWIATPAHDAIQVREVHWDRES
jgi:4-amino-4-deoxy-L-arabinose transferase-like glycosyltransferase